jgi:very-short-patch-repair endonuclease
MTERPPKYLPKIVPDTIATRFAGSFSDFAARTEYTAILRPVEQEINTMAFAASMGRPFDCRDLLSNAARGFVKQAAAGTVRNIVCGAAAHCESAIELAFSLALGMASRAKEYATLYDFGGCKVYGDPDGDVNLRIQPQVVLYGCRVDFLVSMNLVRESETGIEVFAKQTVVECDGHEFHDRTKEQASRDRERDRTLQQQGLAVLRFTGADIWRDVFACADEVLCFLRAKIEADADSTVPKKPCGAVFIRRSATAT